MLKIKDNVDLKELEKFGIVPYYDVIERTGETYISYFGNKDYLVRFGGIKFGRKKKIFKTMGRGFDFRLDTDVRLEYFDINKLYDLIKADLVVKVDE
jgi:hypothetical protein